MRRGFLLIMNFKVPPFLICSYEISGLSRRFPLNETDFTYTASLLQPSVTISRFAPEESFTFMPGTQGEARE